MFAKDMPDHGAEAESIVQPAGQRCHGATQRGPVWASCYSTREQAGRRCGRVALVEGSGMASDTRTQPWFMLSGAAGNMIQLGGLLCGFTLVAQAARARVPWRTRLLLAGWLVTYFCNHAIAHWTVGRLGGIHFVGYGVHGTTSPDWYPPGLRWIFRHLPLLSARTDPASLRAAHPAARLAMYLAAPLFTLLTGLGIPLYGQAKGIARARALLIGASLWFTPMLIVEAIRQGGDLQRAWRELRRIASHTDR